MAEEKQDYTLNPKLASYGVRGYTDPGGKDFQLGLPTSLTTKEAEVATKDKEYGLQVVVKA